MHAVFAASAMLPYWKKKQHNTTHVSPAGLSLFSAF
jgi:hypothetical protein